jgi:hypothetical protein
VNLLRRNEDFRKIISKEFTVDKSFLNELTRNKEKLIAILTERRVIKKKEKIHII